MKKNFNINLAGHLFAIDEDAYALLLNYTETLRRYYRKHDEGEEVVDDIEGRIAELFNELKAQGYNAVTLKHVQDVIQRIGNLEDLTDGEAGQTQTDTGPAFSARGAAEDMGEAVRGAWNKVRSGKRFYRDTENKLLAGVLAGCAKYFGGDALVWRLIFLAVVFLPIPLLDRIGGLSLSLVIFYFIMAILAPAASTPEEVLKMRGEEVNPYNLAGEVTRQSTQTAYSESAAARRRTFNMILAALTVLLSLSLWIAFIGIICFTAAFVAVPDYLMDEMFHLPESGIPEHLLDLDTLGSTLLAMLCAISCCLFIMAYTTAHAALSLMDKIRGMGLAERVGWLIAWLVSIVAIVMASTSFAARVKQLHDLERMDVTQLERIEQIADSIEAAIDSVENMADSVEDVAESVEDEAKSAHE